MTGDKTLAHMYWIALIAANMVNMVNVESDHHHIGHTRASDWLPLVWLSCKLISSNAFLANAVIVAINEIESESRPQLN